MNDEEINIDEILSAVIPDEESNGPGRGKKYCPKCTNYIGARQKICNCGFEFNGQTFKPPQELTAEQLAEQAYAIKHLSEKCRLIYTPSGKCPVKLLSLSEEDIYDWCDSVIDLGLKNRLLYYTTALIYWLREFVDINSVEYKLARKTVQNWSMQ